MRDVREIYPSYTDDHFYGPSDYTPIIEACGEVVVREDQNDYQGDTWALLRRGDEWGYLCFGWGSCSGCDALQACDNVADLQCLADEIEARVTWRTRDEMREWFRSHDWAGDYHATDPDRIRFTERALEALA